MPAAIAGLDAFNLTRAALARVQGRSLVAHVSLATYDVTSDVVRRPPKERAAPRS